MVESSHQRAAIREQGTYIHSIQSGLWYTRRGMLEQAFHKCRAACGMTCPQMWKIALHAMLNTERTQKEDGKP